MQIWHFGIQFSRHGGVGLTAGLDVLRGLFQPTILQFYELHAVMCKLIN